MTDLDRELRATHGLTLSSYVVLSEAAAAPGGRIRMGELAERALLTRPGLCSLVDRLEAARLLQRQPDAGDARGTFAVITGDGLHKLQHAAHTQREAVRRRYTGRLTDAQLAALGDVWRRLLSD